MAEKVKMLIPEEEVNARIEELGKKISEEYAGKEIGFVVPQTSLRKTMKMIFKSIYGLTPSQVISPSDVTKKKYDTLTNNE